MKYLYDASGTRGVLLATALFAMAACGGDSDSDGADADAGDVTADSSDDASSALTRELAGRVVPPDGFGPSTSTLRVQTAAEEAPLEADGSFVVDAAIAGENLVFILDADDDIVLMGFADSSGTRVVDAHSTASALLYLALHLYAAPPNARVALLAEVRAHAATAELGDAVASELVADPKSLMGDGAVLLGAVEEAIATLTAASVFKNHSADETPIRPASGSNGLVTLSPTVAQSGVEVEPSADNRGVQVNNLGRRAAWYYVYRTAEESESGDVTELEPPVLISEGLVEPSRAANNSRSALSDILTGGISYDASPLAGDVWVEVPDGRRSVQLEAIVAGAHRPDVSETPTWYDPGDPRHPEWQARAELMTRVSFLRDLLFPTLASFVFPTDYELQGGDDIDDLEALAQELITAAPGVGEALERGDWGDALRSSLDLLGRDQDARIAISTDLFEELAPGSAVTARFALGRMQDSEFLITLHDIDSRAASIGVVFSSLDTADALERWEGEALRATVLLTARRPTLDPPHLWTDILATIPGADESERFCFLWTVEEGPGGLEGLLDGPDTGSARSVMTDQPQIDYRIESNELADGPLGLISARVYQRPDGGCVTPPDEDTLLGEAAIRIAGSEEEIVPCRDGFDYPLWQTFDGGIGLSVSGSAGGTASVSFFVPEDTTEFEDGYRDVNVYFPLAVEGGRDAFRVSGDARITSSSIDEVIIPFVEETMGVPVFLAGGANISLRAKGAVRITARTRGSVASCRSDDPGRPACCPYISYLDGWGSVFTGALGYAFVPSVGFSFAPLNIP